MPNNWRVGSKIPLNVYEGDRPVCQCHSEEDARRIVAAMNASAGEGVSLIAAERQRQVSVEGWTPEHDDEHQYGELTLAAMCYIEAKPSHFHRNIRRWPWDSKWWKPKDRISNLARAGALIAAEIDRLKRARDLQTEREVLEGK